MRDYWRRYVSRFVVTACIVQFDLIVLAVWQYGWAGVLWCIGLFFLAGFVAVIIDDVYRTRRYGPRVW